MFEGLIKLMKSLPFCLVGNGVLVCVLIYCGIW